MKTGDSTHCHRPSWVADWRNVCLMQPVCPINVSLPYNPLDNIWAMMFVWRLRWNIIRTAPCWVVWHSVHSQQHIHMSSSYRSSRLVCHIGTLMLCAEAVAWSCIIVTWWSGPRGIQALSARLTSFLQCFDTVGLVIWPVKVVSDMTCNVFGGSLNLAQSICVVFKCLWLCMLDL